MIVNKTIPRNNILFNFLTLVQKMKYTHITAWIDILYFNIQHVVEKILHVIHEEYIFFTLLIKLKGIVPYAVYIRKYS